MHSLLRMLVALTIVMVLYPRVVNAETKVPVTPLPTRTVTSTTGTTIPTATAKSTPQGQIRTPSLCPASVEQAYEYFGGDPSGWEVFQTSNQFHYRGTRIQFVVPPRATVWRPTESHLLYFPGDYVESGLFVLSCVDATGIKSVPNPPATCGSLPSHEAYNRFGGDRYGWTAYASYWLSHSPKPIHYQGTRISLIVPQRAIVWVDEQRYLPGDVVDTTHLVMSCY